MSGVAQTKEEVPAHAAMPVPERRAGKGGPQLPEAPGVTKVHVAHVARTARVLAPVPKAPSGRSVPQDQEALAVMPMQEVLGGMNAPQVREARAATIVPPNPEAHAATTAQVDHVQPQALPKADRQNRGIHRAVMSAPSARVIR